MHDPTIPPLPSSLCSTILASIVPSLNVPLPPDLLSTALLQRHAFMPPSLDDPLSHFSPSSASVVPNDAEETLDNLARRLGEADHPPLEPRYRFLDLQSLQAQIRLYPSHSSLSSPLCLLFVYEGEKGWRFHELAFVNLDESSAAIGWSECLPDLLEQGQHILNAHANQGSDEHNAEGEGVIAGDEDPAGFWEGFSDEEDQEQPPIEVSRPEPQQTSSTRPLSSNDRPASRPKPVVATSSLPSTPATSANEGADYWASYASVEDAILPTNPNSPRPDALHDSSPNEAWGTGGETPIGWTPAGTPGISRSGSVAPSATGDTDEGTMPIFPQPLFKGATPANSPPMNTRLALPGGGLKPPMLTPPLTPASSTSTPLHLAMRGLLQMHSRSSGASPANSAIDFLEVAKEIAAEALSRTE